MVSGQGDLHRRLVQGSPTMDVTFFHGLGKYPSVTIKDSAGSVIRCKISYPDIQHVRIQSNYLITFEALLN
jgi:hypothetical protein